MTSAEGKSGMKQVWKRSPWVDYAGTLEGRKVGVTIMDHPGNRGTDVLACARLRPVCGERIYA